MEIEVVRSRRKTLAVQVKNGQAVIRAPLRASDTEIRRFVEQYRGWIETRLAESRAREAEKQQVPKLTKAEISALKEEARRVIPQRAAYYARLIGTDYGKITIRCQKTRWGSCTAKGDLSFNCLLMLMPESVMDSIVVHELCHRKYMNHSARFYEQVRRVFPEYNACRKWLKEHDEMILARVPEA